MNNEAAAPAMPIDDQVSVVASPDAPTQSSAAPKRNNQRRRPNTGSTAPALDLGPQPKKERQRPADQGNKPNNGVSRNVQRNREHLNFVPRVSHPADAVEITLKSEYATRLYAQHYGRAQVSLYNVTSVLPVLLRQAGYEHDHVLDIIDQVEMLLNARIDELRDKIDVELRRMKKLSESNGAPPSKKYSQPPQTIAVAGLSPQILEMLNILQQYDQMVAYVHGLWLGRAFTSRQKEEAINNIRNEIARLIRSFMRIYQGAKLILEQKGDIASVANILDSNDNDHVEMSEEDESKAREIVAPVADSLHGGFHGD